LHAGKHAKSRTQSLNVTVLHESWRFHPLALIHYAEACSVAAELRRAGYSVRLARFRDDSDWDLSREPLLLRLSDSVMLMAVQALTRMARPFFGPSAAVMERCYDKYEACRIATASGVDCPATTLASTAAAISYPVVLKPRRGSDSLGVRFLRGSRIPAHRRTEDYIIQQRVRGAELTIAVFHGRIAGTPLRIHLPEGAPYSFFRKYLLRPPRAPLADAALAERVRRTALGIARMFTVNWAARIDLIYETATDRLHFLECDVAPLVGATSAFAASLEAAGINRAEQLRMLLNEPADHSD
jgi:D-alanine-D-alanine ligase-like ATP-grasp enzyme